MNEANKASIILDGDVAPLRQKLREAGNDLKKFGTDGEKALAGMAGPLAMLQSKFIAIGAILTGGKVFHDAVGAAKDFHLEVGKLAKIMGTSEDTAVALRYALGDMYLDMGTAEGAVSKLVQTMNNSPEKFAALGVSVIDASGKARSMLDIMLDVNARINEFSAGTDRNRAAAYIYGRQWMEVQKILQLTNERLEEGAAKARALGIELNTDEIKAYRAAMHDVDDSVEAMNVRIGTALIPSLKSLAVYFANVGGPVIDAVVWAFKHLIQFVDETVLAFRLAWNDIEYVFTQLTTAAGQMGAAVVSVLKGDFQIAKDVWKQGHQELVTNQEKHQAEYERLVTEHAERVKKLWTAAAKAKASGGNGGKTFNLPEDGPTKEKSEPSFMQYYEAELAARKSIYEQENTLRQFSKEQELAYWREIQQNLELTSKDRVAIAKRTATLEVEIRRQAAKEARELDSVMVDSRRAAGLAEIQLAEQQSNFARENGAITKSELLALEEQYARRRFEIEYQALLERLELAKSDPNASPAELARIKEQMLEVERNYQLRRGEIVQGNKKEEGGIGGFFDGIGDSFGQAANAILTKATTLQQALGGIFQGIYQSFVANLISKPLGEWAAGLAKMLAIKLGFLAEEKTADATAMIASKLAKKAEGFTGVQANAAVAATGAAASQASIPIVGPMLAMAAMAQTFAQVSAFGNGMLAVAAKGYDIPKGLNPLAQLHEEEMVLPKQYANVIRGLAGSAGEIGSGGGDTHHHHYSISAMDSRSFRDYVKTNSHALAPGLRQLARNFTPVKGR